MGGRAEKRSGLMRSETLTFFTIILVVINYLTLLGYNTQTQTIHHIIRKCVIHTHSYHEQPVSFLLFMHSMWWAVVTHHSLSSLPCASVPCASHPHPLPLQKCISSLSGS